MAEQAGDLARSEMPLLDHLVELRTRLLWCVAWFVLAFGVCMFFATDIFAFLLWPFEQAAHGETDLQLIYTAPHEFFFTQIKLAMFAGLFVAFPFIAYQLYRFIAPGLYKNERRAFLPYLIASPLLFALGASLVFFLVMPMAFEFFLSMQQSGSNGGADVRMVNRVSEYLSFTMVLMMAFGLCFQLPVILDFARAHRPGHGRWPARQTALCHCFAVCRCRCADTARPYQSNRAGCADAAFI